MKIRKLFIIPLSALLLSSCTIISGGGGGGGGGGKTTTDQPSGDTNPTSNVPGGEVTDGSYNGYYDLSKYDLNGLKGPNLQRVLHNMMLDTHHSLIKYSQFSNYIKQTTTRPHSVDQVDAKTNLNQYFYTGKEVNFSTSMTREHVWPCAKSAGMWVHSNYTDVKYYVDGTNYVGGGSDLYHVRPCTSSVNTARGDSRFIEWTEDERNSGNLVNITDGGKYTLLGDASSFSQYSEPADEFKGDVARICFYVYIHYAAIGNYGLAAWGDYLGNLSLQDLFGHPGDSERKVYEQIVRWNELDPVSETEKLRNETVFAIQGNRNPFVDYPHLVRQCLIF